MFVTLTYPGKGGEFPLDGVVTKGHFHTFTERWRRRWTVPLMAIWKLEYQRRKAPHFHIAVAVPHAQRQLVLNWVSRNWAEVIAGQCGAVKHTFKRGKRKGQSLVCRHQVAVRNGDPVCAHQEHTISSAGTLVASGVNEDHWRYGTQVKAWQGHVASYLAGYTAKDKSYQNRVPEGVTNVGRWWGVLGGRDPSSPARVVWSGMALNRQEAAEMRRLMGRYRAAQCKVTDARKRHRCRRGMAKASSLWVAGGPTTDYLVDRLLTAARRSVEAKQEAAILGHLPDALRYWSNGEVKQFSFA